MGQLKDILSISGQPGLFKFISQARNGIIAEGLEDKKRMRFGSTAKISALEDIAVYTDEKEMPLLDVFRAMKNHLDAGEKIDPKADPASLKSFFEQVLPNYDKERVYVSDIKKIVKWFFILHALDFDFSVQEEASDSADAAAKSDNRTDSDEQTKTGEQDTENNNTQKKDKESDA